MSYKVMQKKMAILLLSLVSSLVAAQQNPQVSLKTDLGTIVIELYPK